MLAEILHKIAADTQEDRHPYRQRPSMAGPERCIRSMVYHAMDFPANPFPGRAIMVFDDSLWHEQLTADWIRKSAFQIHSEQMVVQTLVGPGSIDAIITDLLGTDKLLEGKALSHFSFERIWRQGPTACQDYLTQLALYIQGVQRDNPDIREGLLLIKNKNTSQYMDMAVSYDKRTDTLYVWELARSDGQKIKQDFKMELVCESAARKFSEVELHKKAKSLPKRPFEIGTDFPCSYCSWGATCWAGYEQEWAELGNDAIEDEELEQSTAYYLETSRHITEMDKEKKMVRDKIIGKMREKNLREARVGPYTLKRELRSTTSWNQDLMPPDVIAIAKEENWHERINIRKPKPKAD